MNDYICRVFWPETGTPKHKKDDDWFLIALIIIVVGLLFATCNAHENAHFRQDEFLPSWGNASEAEQHPSNALFPCAPCSLSPTFKSHTQ